eukprot:CAMPEP_0196131220 /NCGR_PEP_ID=MMETSP0910-20130528/1319_1 /TAXON_ID=49265 /ORGANISM="Thalassiosira rotula, Strain GSO102" /LENGTH=281 /DNA_ID=CAMNT_0041390669 /DNA_START=102 /DNA_END=947 /DNA_ORIENTATION=+
MTSQKSRANMEACQMIEAMLFELNPSLDKKQANRLARQLVSFRAFQKSLDSNTGIKCLQLRLKKLSQMLLNVADRRRRRQASSSKLPTSPTPANAKDVSTMVQNLSLDTQDAHQTEVTTRHHILINTVGESKYNDILSVHREILRIRQQSAVWTKFSPIRQLRHDKFDDNRHLIHEEEEEEEEERAPIFETLPAPIADIYFRTTRLMNAMCVVDTMVAKKTLDDDEVVDPGACVIQQTDWDMLLRGAQVKLAAFRKFESEHFEQGNDLTFRCRGVCSFGCK